LLFVVEVGRPRQSNERKPARSFVAAIELVKGARKSSDSGCDVALCDATRDRSGSGLDTACSVAGSVHFGGVSRRVWDRERRALAGGAHHDGSRICDGAQDSRTRRVYIEVAVLAGIHCRAGLLRRRGHRRKALRTNVHRFGCPRGWRSVISSARNLDRAEVHRDIDGRKRPLGSGCTR
jgi:hypothetical protein